jgi:hypothetical protein
MAETTTFALVPATFAKRRARARLHASVVGLGALAAAALLAVAAPAAAQEAGVDRTAAARALFDEGLALLDAERWEEAADRFQRALALRPSHQITYNLTTALVELGHLVRASELLRQVSRDPTATPEVRQAAEARRAQLLPRIASLTIVPGEDLDRADFFLDERPLEPVLIGVAIPVDPGSHVVTGRHTGRVVVRRELVILEGENAELNLAPAATPRETSGGADAGEPTPDGGPDQREPPRRRGVARQWWFWTIIGAVVVGGAVAAGVVVGTREPSWPEGVQGPGETIYLGGSE